VFGVLLNRLNNLWEKGRTVPYLVDVCTEFLFTKCTLPLCHCPKSREKHAIGYPLGVVIFGLSKETCDSDRLGFMA
jgi:hypothetical protein